VNRFGRVLEVFSQSGAVLRSRWRASVVQARSRTRLTVAGIVSSWSLCLPTMRWIAA